MFSYLTISAAGFVRKRANPSMVIVSGALVAITGGDNWPKEKAAKRQSLSGHAGRTGTGSKKKKKKEFSKGIFWWGWMMVGHGSAAGVASQRLIGDSFTSGKIVTKLSKTNTWSHFGDDRWEARSVVFSTDLDIRVKRKKGLPKNGVCHRLLLVAPSRCLPNTLHPWQGIRNDLIVDVKCDDHEKFWRSTSLVDVTSGYCQPKCLARFNTGQC